MLIRHADPQRDGQPCAEIYGPFVRDSAVSLEHEAPGPDELAGRIERISCDYPWLVAEDQGTVTGYAYASPHRERSGYRWAADVTVYVAAGHRRAGVGRGLYGALLPLLARQGIWVGCAGITLPNPASVALHEAFGFSLVGVYRRIGWKLGAWHDVGWWQVELITPGGRDGRPPDPGPPARLEEL